MENDVYIRQANENKNHWWFESRKEIIKNFIKKRIKKKIKILDFGCGVGINLDMLKLFGNVTAFDENKLAIKQIKNKTRVKILHKFDQLKKYDLVVALDVIEHIDNDKKIIKKLANKINKNGNILITVPAFNTLFTSKDINLHHKRRYNKKTLLRLLDKEFKMERCTYYNFFLSPIIMPMLIFFKVFNINFIDKAEKKNNIIVNFILKTIFSFEKYLINFINFPFGISILYYGKKIK